jgi:two-component system cell cycle sensor histidine kinase/response regulator CckA
LADGGASDSRVGELEHETQVLRERITELERKIATAESRFATAFFVTPDALNVNRISDGVYLAINPGFTALTGYTEADLAARPTIHLDIWADLADRDKLAEGLRTAGVVKNLQARFRTKDGTIKTGLLSAARFDWEGEPCILSITRDISDRIKAEEDLRRNEEKLRSLVELAADAILIGNDQGNITAVNRRTCELLGRTPEELVGRHISVLFDPASLAEQPLRFDLLREGKTVVRERLLRRKDGGRVPVETSAAGLPDGSCHMIMRDLTVRRRVEAERAALQEQRRNADRLESLGRLAGGIAHDMSNMLTPILGAASLLLASPREEDRPDLEVIVEAANRAAALTRQILAFGRRQVLKVEPLDLNAEIAKTDQMLRRVIGEDVAVELQLAPDLRRVAADPSQVQQVILNLAVNARDAMPKGGRLTMTTSQISTDAAAARQHPGLRPGTYVRLDIADTGVGMDGETLRHAFDPFFTTKAEGKGTGLGLAIVGGIVEQHGGVVWATSTPGAGTTFSVCFPVEGSVPSALPSEPRPPPAPSRSGAESILLVEDDALARAMTQKILEGAGYRVVSASRGDAALRLLADLPAPPDLLVTDVIMPGLSGAELCALVRAQVPALRVLYISGHPDSRLTPHGIVAADARLLAKPYNAETLLAAVRAALAG